MVMAEMVDDWVIAQLPHLSLSQLGAGQMLEASRVGLENGWLTLQLVNNTIKANELIDIEARSLTVRYEPASSESMTYEIPCVERAEWMNG